MTIGWHCRPSARSAARAVDSAACLAAAGLTAIDACLAASLAAASTDPWAIEVLPAAITSPIRNKMMGAMMISSRGALPA